MAFDEPLLVVAGEAHAQFVGDLLGNFLLDGHYISELSVVLIAPDLMIRARVHQFRAHCKLIASFRDPAREHRLHLQVTSGGLRVDIRPFVAEHGTARHHRDIRQLRQAIDDAFRNAIAQVVRIGIGAHVYEGQDCDRADGARLMAPNPE